MKPLVLIILDGWGIAEKSPANVISQAKLPILDRIEKFYPFCLLQAAGESLGLPWGEPGNDEIGHFCVGTGRTPKMQNARCKMQNDNLKFKNEDASKCYDGFPPVKNSLSEIISKAGLKQLKIAETIKFEYLTDYFNGFQKEPFPGEERIAIPTVSMRDFGLAPQMRTEETANQIIKNLEKFDFIAANFAASDIVGHSGNLKAAISAAKIIDENLERILETALEINGTLILTSDHGKIEKMMDPRTGKPFLQNTANPVPFYLINYKFQGEKKPKEILAIKKSPPAGIITDIAPTLLELMNLEKPAEMTGQNLLSVISNQ